jgi:2-amino-4-hydroxy-6-hydroxymethyldihydropteridine diphosphokinase|tara:strand:+ start:2496 stop:3008 length:513 start_codon:yes stop_codon:yes gene_type:complete
MVILSLGSNLPSKYGDKFENLKYAISLLEDSDILLDKKSSFYETPSYPDKSKPKFANMVISVKTSLSPVNLMTIIIDIEKKLERIRRNKNDPRTCDIDIIDYKDQIIKIKNNNFYLEIPHKSLVSRNFVLYPLQEILPNWKHPKTKEILSVLINKLNEEDRKSILKINKN